MPPESRHDFAASLEARFEARPDLVDAALGGGAGLAARADLVRAIERAYASGGIGEAPAETSFVALGSRATPEGLIVREPSADAPNDCDENLREYFSQCVFANPAP